MGRDERLWGWLGHPGGLLVGLDLERPREIDASGHVGYCPGAGPTLGEWMIGGSHRRADASVRRSAPPRRP